LDRAIPPPVDIKAMIDNIGGQVPLKLRSITIDPGI